MPLYRTWNLALKTSDCGSLGVARMILRAAPIFSLLLFLTASCGSGGSSSVSPPSTPPPDVGFRDFSFGSSISPAPTGEKPQSKLWWNDGSWWGSLYNQQAGSYQIYRLDVSTQQWVDTGTPLDDRDQSKADVLWDEFNQKLYVVSNRFTANAVPTSIQEDWGRLFRFTYSAGTRTYSLDAGFPVPVTRGRSETLTIAKDSWGRLWVTYVESQKVMVNVSLSSELDWGEPFVLPASAQAVSVDGDDISGIAAFGGNKIGILWSNQVTSKFYFAVHQDGDAATVWQPEETAFGAPACTGACADDHVDLAVASNGRFFAAVKTSLTTSTDPGVVLLVRAVNGTWSNHVIGRRGDGHTRPIVVLDEQSGRIHMFASGSEAGNVIFHKSTSISLIQFPDGQGTAFIRRATDPNINNPTSSKQNLSSTTGMLVLAADSNTRFYLHNFVNLP